MSAAVEFHWIITMNYTTTSPDGRTGTVVTSQSGTITPQSGDSRKTVYGQIHTHAVTQLPGGAIPGAVVFFSLEPNVLGGAS